MEEAVSGWLSSCKYKPRKKTKSTQDPETDKSAQEPEADKSVQEPETDKSVQEPETEEDEDSDHSGNDTASGAAGPSSVQPKKKQAGKPKRPGQPMSDTRWSVRAGAIHRSRGL